jgi:hypothetical protein
VCAVVLGAATCLEPQDCQVFCLLGDAGGAPNPCGLNACPDETAMHGKVLDPGATTCTGTGQGLVLHCAYN